MIDALLSVVDRAVELPVEIDPSKRLILVTAHRRENFGEPFERVCRAMLTLLERNQDV